MEIRHIITRTTDTMFRCNIATINHMFWNRGTIIYPATYVQKDHITPPLKSRGNYILAPTGIDGITERGPLDLKKTEDLNEHICLS